MREFFLFGSGISERVKNKVYIGRSEKCGVTLSSKTHKIRKVHCVIEIKDKNIATLRNYSEKARTIHRGRDIQREEVRLRSFIIIGDRVLRFYQRKRVKPITRITRPIELLAKLNGSGQDQTNACVHAAIGTKFISNNPTVPHT